jgi:hypothetical protein
MRKLSIYLITFLFIISINFNSTVYAVSTTNITSLNESNEKIISKLEEVSQRISETAVYQTIQIIVATVAIAVIIGVYWHQQSSSRKDSIRRACDTILKELEENQTALTTEKHKRITYTTSKGEKLNYTNAFFDTDAYDSVLHSGLFTHFSADTRHKLSLFYSRIKSHNELLDYTNRYEDNFFLNDDSEERKQRWQQEIERYDLLLTKWESEAIKLLDEVEKLVRQERP